MLANCVFQESGYLPTVSSSWIPTGKKRGPLNLAIFMGNANTLRGCTLKVSARTRRASYTRSIAPAISARAASQRPDRLNNEQPVPVDEHSALARDPPASRERL
ncbi:unnamed protein product [Lampetra planeri]